MPRSRIHTSAILFEEMGVTNSRREYTHHRDEFMSYPKGVIGDNTRIGPVPEVLVTAQFGRCGIEVRIGPSAKDGSKIVGRHQPGSGTMCNRVLDGMHRGPCVSTLVPLAGGNLKRPFGGSQNPAPHPPALKGIGNILGVDSVLPTSFPIP